MEGNPPKDNLTLAKWQKRSGHLPNARTIFGGRRTSSPSAPSQRGGLKSCVSQCFESTASPVSRFPGARKGGEIGSKYPLGGLSFRLDPPFLKLPSKKYGKAGLREVLPCLHDMFKGIEGPCTPCLYHSLEVFSAKDATPLAAKRVQFLRLEAVVRRWQCQLLRGKHPKSFRDTHLVYPFDHLMFMGTS